MYADAVCLYMLSAFIQKSAWKQHKHECNNSSQKQQQRREDNSQNPVMDKVDIATCANTKQQKEKTQRGSKDNETKGVKIRSKNEER